MTTSIETFRGTESSAVTSLDRLVVLYLALPNLLYLTGWIKPIYGIPAALLTTLILVTLLWKKRSETFPVATKPLLLAILIASVWIYFSGIGHLAYANTDWVYRDAVLADMTNQTWPVTYRPDATGQERVLRAPLGYYLPAAAVGKVLGSTAALWVLVLWSFSGVLLTFALLLRGVKDTRVALIRMLVFVFFSGMDFVGFLRHGKIPLPGEHLEWWTLYFQYSSMTTALFWVPNHAIACWVAIFWLIGKLPERMNVQLGMFICFCIPLFSPLSAVGLVPLFAMAILTGGALDDGQWFKRVLRTMDPRILGTFLMFSILIYGYLLMAPAGIDSRWSFQGQRPLIYLIHYVTFISLEFIGLTFLLINRYRQDRLLWIIALILLFLPLTRVGPGSDLTMRASLPGLAYLAYKLGLWFTEEKADIPQQSSNSSPESIAASSRGFSRSKMLAIAIFLVGTITPIYEFVRVALEPRWPYDPVQSMVEVDDGVANYMCTKKTAWADWFLP